MLDHSTSIEFSCRNRLLARFDQADIDRLRPDFSLVVLYERDILCEPQKRIESVYFIESGIASLVVNTRRGKTAEVASIGNEGFVGLPVVFGEETATVGAYALVPGSALRLSAVTFRRQFEQSPRLQALLFRYANAVFAQMAQYSACASMHSLEMRCSRWLLGACDRMPLDRFLLTQDHMAMILGVRRSSISAVMGALQKRGLIQYSRGHITILDRHALQATACECYQLTKGIFDRVLCADPNA